MSPIHLAARGIVVKDGKLLAVIHKAGNGRHRAIPGGSVEKDEGILDAMRREMIEETGVAPEVGHLLFVQQYTDHTDPNKRQRVEFFFNIENVEDYENINLAQTTHGALELQEIDFIDPKKEKILPVFLQVDIETLVAKAKNEGTIVYNYL